MADVSQPKGTGFVNLSRILDANKNNKLGNVVGDTLKGRAEGVRNNLGSLTGEFEQKRQAGALDTGANKSARESALNNIMGGNTDISDQTQNQFNTFRAGKYGGPMGLDETKSNILSNKANQLQGDVQGLNTVSGRGALLRQTVGTPQYTQGQEKLDNQLLGQSPQGFAQARQQAQGIAKNVQDQRAAAQQVGQTEVAKAKQFAQDTGAQLQGSNQSILSELQQRAQQANTQRPEVYNSLVAAINAGDITPEQAQSLGLSEGVQTYGANILPYVNQSQIEANASNIAGDSDKARLAALSKLSGQGGNIDLIDPTQAAYAGPLSVQSQGIQDQIAARKAAYDNIMGRGVAAYMDNGFNAKLSAGKRSGETDEDFVNRVFENRGKVGDRVTDSYDGGSSSQNLVGIQKYMDSLQTNIAGYRKQGNTAMANAVQGELDRMTNALNVYNRVLK